MPIAIIFSVSVYLSLFQFSTRIDEFFRTHVLEKGFRKIFKGKQTSNRIGTSNSTSSARTPLLPLTERSETI